MSEGAKVAVIGASARVRGRIAGDEDLVVHGRVEGEIDLRGVLRVEAGAVVRASVRVIAARVRGAVVGDIVATDLIHLGSTAQVVGDVRAPRLVIEPGARIAGAAVVEGELRDEGPRRSFTQPEPVRVQRIEPQPLVREVEPRPVEVGAKAVAPRPIEPPYLPTELGASPDAPPAISRASEAPSYATELAAPSTLPQARPTEPSPRSPAPEVRLTELAVAPARGRPTVSARPAIAPRGDSEPPAVAARPPVPGPPADTIASWQPVRPPPIPGPREVHPASLTPAEPLPHPSMVVDRTSQRPEDSTRRRVMVKLRRRGDG